MSVDVWWLPAIATDVQILLLALVGPEVVC